MTKGNKNVLKSSSENLHKFWDLNKNKKYQKAENVVRTQEQMSMIAKEIIANNEIDEQYTYYELIKRYATGSTITNKFGRKLYFKLGE